MQRHADITVHDEFGQIALVVEIKGTVGRSVEFAMRVRETQLAESLWPGVPFLLLAMPDRFYLWKGENGKDAPDYDFDPAPYLQGYYEHPGLKPGESMDHDGFEMIVSSWLWTVLMAGNAPETLGPGHEWLLESGLLDAIKHGRVEAEVAA